MEEKQGERRVLLGCHAGHGRQRDLCPEKQETLPDAG